MGQSHIIHNVNYKTGAYPQKILEECVYMFALCHITNRNEKNIILCLSSQLTWHKGSVPLRNSNKDHINGGPSGQRG